MVSGLWYLNLSSLAATQLVEKHALNDHEEPYMTSGLCINYGLLVAMGRCRVEALTTRTRHGSRRMRCSQSFRCPVVPGDACSAQFVWGLLWSLLGTIRPYQGLLVSAGILLGCVIWHVKLHMCWSGRVLAGMGGALSSLCCKGVMNALQCKEAL